MQTNERKLTRNELWMEKYHAMKKYLEVHHQLPDKKKPYNHDLINWWKYNKKRVKAGKQTAERVALLRKLNDMRLVKRTDASKIFDASDRLTRRCVMTRNCFYRHRQRKQ